jgi:hypothetical protein
LCAIDKEYEDERQPRTSGSDCCAISRYPEVKMMGLATFGRGPEDAAVVVRLNGKEKEECSPAWRIFDQEPLETEWLKA